MNYYLKYIILFTVFYIVYYSFSTFVKKSIIIEGIRNKIIYFGQTINLTNPDAYAYSNGIILAFYSQNKKGGVHGNTLNLQIYDDNYEAEKAIDNAKILIDYQNVLALIGSWGTPTTYAVYNNVIKDRNVPFIGPYTGGNLLFNNFDKNVIMIRDSYKNEMNTMLLHMKSKKKHNICIFYQNDDFGKGCLNDLIECVNDNNYHINIISKGSYQPGTTLYYDGLNEMFKTDPYNFDSQNIMNKIDAIIFICTSIQKSQLIRYFKKVNPNIYIYTTSFSGSLTKFKDGKNLNTDNIYYTDITDNVSEKNPSIYKTINTEIAEYNKLKNKKQQFIFSDKIFNGWILGKLIIQALESIEEGTINRKKLIDSFYKIKDFKIDDYIIGPFIDNVNNVGRKGIYLYGYDNKSKKYKYIKTYKSVY
jgi:branched-chain amino acid transport system substrate-binding protein